MGQNWHNGVYSSARRAVISGLQQRTDVVFQVTAIGSGQRKGAPSPVAALFVV